MQRCGMTTATRRYNLAARHSDPAVIEALLDAGASLEVRNISGRMPLHSAADSYSRGPAIELLISAGANFDARDEDGNTPLHIAARYSNNRDDENERHAGDAIDAPAGCRGESDGAQRSWRDAVGSGTRQRGSQKVGQLLAPERGALR